MSHDGIVRYKDEAVVTVDRLQIVHTKIIYQV